MADLGDTSQANTAHKHKRTSWVAVALMTIASVVLGFAFVLQSIPLAILGVVLGLVGAVIGVTNGIMDDVT